MIIDRLIEIMPPPVAPVDSGEHEDWAAVEKETGITLPIDYKEFINTYGTGSICSFLWVFNPFTKNRFLNFAKQVNVIHQDMEHVAQFSGVAPYPKFPPASELVSWATTDNGDNLFWRTGGPPDEWSIVVVDSDWAIWEYADGPISSFLVRLLTRELRLNAFTMQFPDGKPYFTPAEKTQDV